VAVKEAIARGQFETLVIVRKRDYQRVIEHVKEKKPWVFGRAWIPVEIESLSVSASLI
jgi:hypothetical protein